MTHLHFAQGTLSLLLCMPPFSQAHRHTLGGRQVLEQLPAAQAVRMVMEGCLGQEKA